MGVSLVCTVDIDHDGVALDERTALAWTSLTVIPAVKSVFDELATPLTWFVRADDQLRTVYGTAAHLLHEHAATWLELEQSGDEIAWHPHLYRWDEAAQLWNPDLDPASCADQLASVHAELEEADHTFTSTRMGEAFHCNETMAAVESLGLRVDSTAIPGRTRRDLSRAFDWSLTPNRPYRPSSDDYRVPGRNPREVLEVPMTSVSIQADYDAAPLPRYVNPTFHHEIFKAALDKHLAAHAGGEEVLVTVFHLDEVCPRAEPHALYAFSMDGLRRNVAYLIERVDAAGLDHGAIRMMDVVQIAGL
jgi:hypothetical protein